MTRTELKRHIIFAFTILIVLLVFTLALYGMLQLFGLSKSNNYNYTFTGSFYNPGPYACYLAVGFTIALRMMLRSGNKFQKRLGSVMVVLTAILVPATMSRTAILACVAGGIIALTLRGVNVKFD